MASEQEKDVLPPNQHQFVQLTVYSEPDFSFLGSGTIANVMSDRLANKLKLSLAPTERRIVVADGSTGVCKGIVSDVPVGFGKIVVRLKFIVLESVPYDLIIVTPALVQIRSRIDMYSQIVQVRKDGKTEVLNLVYEPKVFYDTDDELTTDTESETDGGEVSDKDEFSGFLMTLDATKEAKNEPEEAEFVRQKV